MNKKILMDALLEILEANRQMLASSALEARAAATGDDAKPENKYDTRGLEASYLAGAQAKRSHDLEVAIQQLKRFKLRDFDEDTPIDLTAVVEIEVSSNSELITRVKSHSASNQEKNNELETKHFFLLPYAGGTKIEYKKRIYHVITPDSPLGRQLAGKLVGDSFMMKLKDSSAEHEILSVS